MKKIATIALISLALGAIISPVVGMAIGGTRSLILGLAPNDAVLKLADEIDANRQTTESKTSELEGLIDDQKNQLAEQQSIIDQQNTELGKQKGEVGQAKTEVATASAGLTNEQNCRKANELYVNIPKKPKKACSVLGANNIVDMYKAIKHAYEDAKKNGGKDSNGTSADVCFKDYLNVLEPAYNEYLKAKELCK